MRLRRTMAAAAVTAAIVPAALLTTTAAFADTTGGTTASTGDTTTDGTTGDTTGDTTAGTSGDTTGGTTGDTTGGSSTGDTATSGITGDTTGGAIGDTTTGRTTGGTTTGGTTGDTTTRRTTGKTTTGDTTGGSTPTDCPTDGSHTLETSISGLSGEIAAGSGWHKFTLTITNTSDNKVSDLTAFAGASRDKKGENLYKSNTVTIQYYDDDTKSWTTIDEGGHTIGYFAAQTLKSGYAVDFPLRVNVRAGAPVGKTVTIGGGGVYRDKSGCDDGTSAVKTYKIVASGTDTNGTEPQTGGKAPVPSSTPDTNTLKPTGSLAETGSSSALPMISLAGGAAVVVGGGAMFVVRRRKTGAHV
jgi:LPXTG-motif cell wall-anchored protein